MKIENLNFLIDCLLFKKKIDKNNVNAINIQYEGNIVASFVFNMKKSLIRTDLCCTDNIYTYT